MAKYFKNLAVLTPQDFQSMFDHFSTLHDRAKPMTIWLVLTESQFVCKDYIEYSSVQIISSIIGATSFYFDLHSSVVNIRRFL